MLKKLFVLLLLFSLSPLYGVRYTKLLSAVRDELSAPFYSHQGYYELTPGTLSHYLFYKGLQTSLARRIIPLLGSKDNRGACKINTDQVLRYMQQLDGIAGEYPSLGKMPTPKELGIINQDVEAKSSELLKRFHTTINE